LDAKVLPEPKLIFDRNESASINNGLWDLRNKKFAKPAGLRAFAVVDFSSGGRSMPYVKNLLQVVDRSSWFHSIEGSPKRNLKKFYENVTPTSKSFSRRITCSGSPIYRVSVVGKKIETDGSGSRNSCAQCGKLTHIYCTNCHVWFCGPHVGRCDEEGRSTVVCFSNTPKIYGLKTCWMDWHESGLQMMHEQITMNDE